MAASGRSGASSRMLLVLAVLPLTPHRVTTIVRTQPLCATELDDDADVPLAFQMLARRTMMGRFAPAKGKGLNTRDASSAAAIKELLTTKEPIDFNNDALPAMCLTSRLGEGRFGDVLLGEGDDGQRFAVKVALRATSRLSLEANVLRKMGGTDGFPQLMHYQPAADGLEMMVMELLGHSVQSEWEAAGRRFAASTALSVGRGAYDCLCRLHAAGHSHNDLKPGNLLRGSEPDRISLIDFGLATELGGEEIAQVGSTLYASLTAHEATRPTTAADDFESLAYMLVHLVTGTLPWADATPADVATTKRQALGGSESLLGCILDAQVRIEIRRLLRHNYPHFG